jgi:hypothetical protein
MRAQKPRMQVPSRRQSRFAICLHAATLLAGLLLASGSAVAQNTGGAGALDPALLRPSLDGNPQNPARFRRSGTDPPVGMGIGDVPNYDYKGANGAASTGFDSSGVGRKKNAKKPTNGAAKAATAGATAGKPVALVPDPPAPVVLTAAEAARLQKLQMRRVGGPPLLDPALLAATQAVPQLRRLPRPDDLPFDPTGVQVGSFLLRPAIEATRGYDTNPARTLGGPGSWMWVIAPELQANSNWDRHELTANVKSSYTSYDSQHDLDRPTMDAKVNGRIDVTSLSRIDLEARMLVGTDRPGSPNIQADLAKLPVFTTFGGSVGWGQRFNRFEVSLKGGIDRTVYQDSHFVDGSTESNLDRNVNQYSALLRTSYDLIPGMKPFLELSADARRHDIQPDSFGVYRDSNGYSVKAGSTFLFSTKLTGEASVGYLTRSYQDPTLPNLSGVTVDAALVWAATALTTAKLTATTRADETTVPGVSGIFTRETAFEVDHAFRRWLIGTVKFSRALDDYDGSPRIDYRYAASSTLTYMLTREWQLKAEYRNEWRTSNVAGQGYSANVYLLGVRLQR